MNKLATTIISLLVLTVVFASSIALAQQSALISAKNQARIWVRGAYGAGIATSTTDPMNFEFIKVGLAGVKYEGNSSSAMRNVGLLFFGEDKYRLQNVVIGNGSASADIYTVTDDNPNSTSAIVGTLSLDSYVKGDREVWAGSMTLNSESYNVYVIQVNKKLTGEETARYIHEYCTNNPERCRAAMKAVGQIYCDPVTDDNCRNRIKSFCETNPDDSRCKNLRLEYCKNNTEDSNCREELMERCKENVQDPSVCERLGQIYNKKYELTPEALEKAPEWIKTVTDNIKTKVYERVKQVAE